MNAEKTVKRPESSLPWKVCNDTPSGFKIISDTPYGGVVAETTNWWASTQGARDNAEFIVEACNSYDKLVAVIENLVDDIAGLKGREGEDRDRAILSCNSWFSVLRARSLLGKDKV